MISKENKYHKQQSLNNSNHQPPSRNPIVNHMEDNHHLDYDNNKTIFLEHNDDYNQPNMEQNDNNSETHIQDEYMTGRESLRRSNRIRRPTWKVKDNQEQGLRSFNAYYDALHEEDYSCQDEMMNPIAFLAKTDDDTMYFHQAMK